jgi:hypothetical protein
MSRPADVRGTSLVRGNLLLLILESIRVNKRAAMLELDPLPLESDLLETLHLAPRKNRHPPLSIY